MTVAEAAKRQKASISDAEWRARVDLAALYRILDHFGMTYLIYTHLSARVPGEDGHFLINRYGEMFDEVTASSLIKMDFDGNVIGEGSYNRAGFAIHSAVYMARPDPKASRAFRVCRARRAIPEPLAPLALRARPVPKATKV